MNKIKGKTRIAVQNKGRLMQPSLDYLELCGLQFETVGRDLVIPCRGREIEVIFVRNSDIPEYVRYGVADYGIVGKNVLMERRLEFEILRKLNFGKCELVVAVPQGSDFKSLEDLEHERIATSYPKTLARTLKARKVSAAVIEIKGSVEICPRLGLSDAVFDISQTGNTLRANGLRVLEKITESQAVLIKNPNTNTQYEEIFK